ncbi:MAG: hypothetical protein K2P92_08595 [Bdellovibrionaceae bacterium]|nr:hypothetical protein [Pseudobdellovibrionaceae bacterium]
MKMVFFSFILSGFFASAYQLELKPKGFLKLDQKVWTFGQGQLVPNTNPVNLYSHKKNKDEQITYEDLFLPKSVINERLPQECKGKLNLEKAATGEIYCKFSTDEKSIQKYSFTVISIFNTSTKDVLRVRSVFFIGQKKNMSELENRVDSILNNTSFVKSKK